MSSVDTSNMSAKDVKQMFLSQLKCYLDKHKMREAMELFRNDQMKQLIATDSDILWDLIPMICHRLRGLNEFRFKTFNYCEQLLLEVSVLCKPKEVLIAFLAELETDTIGGNDGSESSASMATACDHNVFKAILKPLECVLIQLPTKRNETLKWVLSTLNAHISRLSTDTIDDYQFDGQEKQFIDNDPNAKQINSVLPLYISFIQTFVNEVDVTKKSAMASTTAPTANGQTVAASKTSDPQVQRTVLLKALLRLLDHPLLHLDLSSETCGESRALAIDVVRLISRLQSNYYSLIERIDLISSSKRSAKHADSADIAVTKEVFAAAMANLSYLVHTECALSHDDLDIDSFVPCVYTHVYVLGVHLPYVDALLRSSVCLVYEKGLHLADRLLSHINDMELEAHFVDLIRATPVERSLIALMVYSPVESHRKRALHVFRRLIVAFDGAGRYKMLVSILSQPAQHAGVQGLAIGIYKDFMFTSALFQGSHLHRWLKLAIKCALPDGVGTDLLEQNDTIFATLNAIRYACLKDHKAANETKLWDVVPYVRDQLLRPLHKALDLSRAHYKLELCKLRELKTGGGKGKGGPGVEVRIAGGGNGLLPNLPPDHKHRIVLLALQNFDLIESVLVRVEEIVDE